MLMDKGRQSRTTSSKEKKGHLDKLLQSLSHSLKLSNNRVIRVTNYEIR